MYGLDLEKNVRCVVEGKTENKGYIYTIILQLSLHEDQTEDNINRYYIFFFL